MLTYFPSPYANEWWWSVLCRYFVRSGYHNHATAFRELLPSPSKSVGRLFPSNDIYTIVARLPSKIFSVKDIILQHTLAPYYLRFYSGEKKASALDNLFQGQSIGLTSIELNTPEGKQGLKWCPICRQEDEAAYGEPYWHREHQIPLLPLCPHHGCRLVVHEIPFSRLSEMFVPLCSLPSISPQYASQPWEAPLAKALSSFLLLPYEVGPPSYSNLTLSLRAQRFGTKALRYKNSIDVQKIWASCSNLYGSAIMKQYFPKPSPAVIYRICHWKLSSPERYALLMVLAGLSSEELFGPELAFSDPVLEKLIQYQRQGFAYNKDALAKDVGVSTSQLDTLARIHGIKPFWKQCSEGRTESIRVTLTADEKRTILDAAAAHGKGQIAVFARSILLQESEKILSQTEEEQ